MIFKKIFIFILWFFVNTTVFSQYKIDWVGSANNVDTSWAPNINYHSSIYPNNLNASTDPFFELNKKMGIAPLVDIGLQLDGKLNFRSGIGIAIESKNFNKFYFRLGGVMGFEKKDSLFHSSGLYLSKSTFFIPTIRMGYKLNKFFDGQIGYDKNFIGDGCRSLLLSDYGKPYPFIRLNAKFWHIDYSIYYQFLSENVNNNYRSKFASTHYVSWNASRWWNFGIFESVIFQPRDTMLYRGFDAEYLNPMVFFRPQEYSLGSADNVILGLNASYKWNRNVAYGQLIIDDFIVKQLVKRTGWWGNKIGWQLGWKFYNFYKKQLIKSRIEINAIRPFTYSHTNELANYGNQGMPLAHPRGANNCELLYESSSKIKKFYFKAILDIGYFGINIDNLNYGSNIYWSYNVRPFDFHWQIGEGIRNYFIVLNLHAAYNLLKEGNIYAFAETQFRFDSAIQGAKFKLIPTIGIRSYLWNDYRNY